MISYVDMVYTKDVIPGKIDKIVVNNFFAWDSL
jgi:hypothetical protein